MDQERIIEELERKQALELAVAASIAKRYEICPGCSFYVRTGKIGREVASDLGVKYGPQVASLLIKLLRPQAVWTVWLSGKRVFKGLKEKKHGEQA